MGIKIAAVCFRAGVKQRDANAVLAHILAKKPSQLREEGPWAIEIRHDGKRWVVAKGQGPFLIVLPLPFKGWVDEWKTIPPLKRAKDLLHIL